MNRSAAHACGPRHVENRGRFIKPCPGTPNHVCCGYRIIDIGHGCTLGCSYCILNHYFKDEEVLIFRDRERLFAELDRYLENTRDRARNSTPGCAKKLSRKFVRFGTGEFTDSLAFDDFFTLYRKLIPAISRSENAVLELKTKTVNIKPILDIEEHDHVILSWTLNSNFIAENEEKGAPSIAKRIAAAKEATGAGYKIGLHFDPIVLHEGWEEGYRDAVQAVFRSIPPQHVVYVSMGTLRFIPEMRRKPEWQRSCYRFGEFIKGADGKMRYFRPLRVEAYRVVKSLLNEHIDEDRIYLCMESSTVWEDVFHITDMTSKKLAERLDEACINSFPTLSRLNPR